VYIYTFFPSSYQFFIHNQDTQNFKVQYTYQNPISQYINLNKSIKMSGIVNKIKDALHHDKSDTTHNTTTGHSTTTTGHHTATGSGAPHGTATHTAGPHDSNLANKADPRVDSDRDGSNLHNTHGTTHHTSGVTGTHGTTTAGPHDSNLANKADPRVDSDRDGSNLHNTHGTTHNTTGVTGTHGSTNAGPHSSNLANKADPRVDSDRDGSHGKHGTVGVGSDRDHPGYYNIPHHGTTTDSSTGPVHNTGNTTTNTFGGSSNPGVYGAGSSTIGSSNHGTTTAGPHSSNLANKADPRVDSDRDGSNLHNTHGTTGHSSTTHSNTHSSTSTAGPHNSNLLNKLDPRVDSDRDGSKTAGNNNNTTTGYNSTSGPHQTDTANKLDPRIDSDRDGSRTVGQGNTAYSGTHTGNHGVTGNTGYNSGVSHSTNAGPHDSNIANKADPRVDSDLDGRGNRHGANTTSNTFGTSGSHATAGSGTAQNTAGPHNSDLLNKLDPRVDSDRDASKTIGRDQTHA